MYRFSSAIVDKTRAHAQGQCYMVPMVTLSGGHLKPPEPFNNTSSVGWKTGSIVQQPSESTRMLLEGEGILHESRECVQ